jgi:hypothetical protein
MKMDEKWILHVDQGRWNQIIYMDETNINYMDENQSIQMELIT